MTTARAQSGASATIITLALALLGPGCAREMAHEEAWIVDCTVDVDRAWILAATPDGKRGAFMLFPGVCLADLETGEVLYRHDTTCYRGDVEVSPCSRWVVANPSRDPGEPRGDKTPFVLDARTGKRLYDLDEDGDLFKAAFSADGSRLFTSHAPDQAWIRDAATGAKLVRVPVDARLVFQAEFSPDGRFLVTGMRGMPSLWDAATAAKLATFDIEGGSVFVHFSHDGGSVLVGDKAGNGKVHFFSASPPHQRLRTVDCAAYSLPALIFCTVSPDRSLMAMAEASDTVTVRETGSGNVTSVISVKPDAGGFRFMSADLMLTRSGRYGSPSSTCDAWNPRTGTHLYALEGRDPAHCSPGPSCARLFDNNDPDDRIRIRDGGSGEVVFTVPNIDRFLPLGDGRLLVVVDAINTARPIVVLRATHVPAPPDGQPAVTLPWETPEPGLEMQ